MDKAVEAVLVPEPPHGLGDDGQRVWRTVSAFASWISPADLLTLELLASYIDRRARLINQIEQNGEVLIGPNGGQYLSPATTLLLSTDEKIIKLIQMLGLSPVIREKVGLLVDRKLIDYATGRPKESKLEALKRKQRESRHPN